MYSMVSLPKIPPTLPRMAFATSSDSTSENRRPNLVYRKAKLAGKTVEELKSSDVPVPKFRGEAVFGVYPVLEALATGKRTIFGLYMKDTVRSRHKEDERIAKILSHARNIGLPVKRLTHSQFDKLTDYQLHNGVCLDASPLALLHIEDVSTVQLTSIYLDNVLDPGNLGAIARSAMFFGCGQIAYSEGRGKASCGALESFHLARVPSFLSYHKLLKSYGARFLGTSDADSANKYKKPLMDLRDLKVQPKEKVVIVLGDEGVGVSEEVIDNCDLLLSINSANSKKTSVNSLNVSVVAGNLLHHIAAARQSQ